MTMRASAGFCSIGFAVLHAWLQSLRQNCGLWTEMLEYIFPSNHTFFRNIMKTSSSCPGQPVRRVTCCVAAKAAKAAKAAPLL